MKPLDILMAVSVPVCWATGFVVAKVAITDFPPILLMAFRFLLTALVLVWFFRPPRALYGKLFLIALIAGSVQYSLTFSGLRHLDASTAGLIVQSEVPFAALVAAIFLKEHVSLKTIAGMVLAFVGVIVISGTPSLAGQEIYVAMVLGGAFTWAVGQVMARSVGEIGGFVMITGVAMFAAPQLFVASLLFETGQIEAIRNATPIVWIAILYMGLVMTAIAYAIWYNLIGRFPVNSVAPFLLLLPVAIVAESTLFLGESLTVYKIAGGALIIAGVALVTITRGPGKPAEEAVRPET